MRLSEKIIPRRYNPLANDWTPLSRKPCWLSNAFHCRYIYMKRNRFAWFRLPILSTQIPSADNKLQCACDKSFADDLVPSRYCKRESNLCITIRWGFCGVSSICSSLISIIICRMPWQSLELSVWADFERMSNGFWADFTRISKVVKSVRKSARNPSGIRPNPPESVRNPSGIRQESARNPSMVIGRFRARR